MLVKSYNLILYFVILLIRIELKWVESLTPSEEVFLENTVMNCIQKSKLICDPGRELKDSERKEISRKALEVNKKIWTFCNDGNNVSALFLVAILPETVNREELRTKMWKASSVLIESSLSHLVFLLKISKDCFTEDVIRNLNGTTKNISQINFENFEEWIPTLSSFLNFNLNTSKEKQTDIPGIEKENFSTEKSNYSLKNVHFPFSNDTDPIQVESVAERRSSNSSLNTTLLNHENVSLQNTAIDNSSVLYFRPNSNVNNRSSLETDLLKHSHHHGILTIILGAFGGGSSLTVLILIFYKFRAAICNICGICKDSQELRDRLID